MSGRKLARRACDGCKIRKIKCNEAVPCDGCINAKIPCTWLKQSQPRGPRRLRDATYLEIRKAQEILQTQQHEAARKGTTRSANVQDVDPPPAPSAEISRLVLHLCVYRIQLYPIFPIIKVERLIASLQSETPDDEVYALAYALAAATAIRTRSVELSVPRKNHAQHLEAKCQAARSKVPEGRAPNLTTVRIAFFLHCYYDSLEPNSMKSMLYLREAITIATMIGLHKEFYYSGVPPQERELRRRVLWLLFVRERQVSVLYDNTPITLRTKIELPSTTDTDEPEILLGFQILTKLFWTLDERGMFEQLDELDVQASPTSIQSGSVQGDKTFTEHIEGGSAYIGYIPPVQDVDLVVTRAWLHVMNLRLLQSISQHAVRRALSTVYSAVGRMVQRLETCQYELLEVQGLSLRLKLDVVSGALQELSNSHVDTKEAREHCNQLIEMTQKIANRLASEQPLHSPSQMLRGLQVSPLYAEPPHRESDWWQSQSAQPNWSPHSDNAAILPEPASGPAYVHQDFAASNNYEGLFDAVQLEGVQSSDAIEDLFDSSSLNEYHTFEDGWSHQMRRDDPSQHSMFDFG